MFDFNNNGTIDFNEFCSLWQYITDWTRTFKGYDLDGNGTIDHTELSQGILIIIIIINYNYLRGYPKISKILIGYITLREEIFAERNFRGI